MKKLQIDFRSIAQLAGLCLLIACCAGINSVLAQDTTASVPKKKLKPVKNTFEDMILIDNQTAMLPNKKRLGFILQHRFSPVKNGYKDFYGLFTGANMSFRFYYSPIKDLDLGIALNKENKQWEGNAKYALMKQSRKGGWPVSVSVYGNFAVDSRPKKDNFVADVDRISYFSQLMAARKVTEKLSVQASFCLSYFNNVEGYFNADGGISPKTKNEHYAIGFLGRYKISEVVGIIADYDQPLTQHPLNNPHPNLSLGFEFGTKGHSFQLFGTNYGSTLPQTNNVYNQNDFTNGEWLVGFNLTRRWHY